MPRCSTNYSWLPSDRLDDDRRHVHGAFDWEAELLELIENRASPSLRVRVANYAMEPGNVIPPAGQATPVAYTSGSSQSFGATCAIVRSSNGRHIKNPFSPGNWPW